MTTNATGRNRTDRVWIASVIVPSLLIAAPAHAYLDPATGSMIIQVVIGTVLGAVLVVKTYWRRIKSYWSPEETSIDEEARGPHDGE